MNRTPAAAQRLAALDLGGASRRAVCDWLPLSTLTADLVARQRVVVNATSLGMAGAG